MTGIPWARGDSVIEPGGPNISAHLQIVAAAHAQAAIANYEQASDLGHVFACFHAGAAAEAMLKAVVATRDVDCLVSKDLGKAERADCLSRIQTATDAALVRSIGGAAAAKEALKTRYPLRALKILAARNTAAHLGLGTRRESSDAIALLEDLRSTLELELGQTSVDLWGSSAAGSQLIRSERIRIIHEIVDSARERWISEGHPERTPEWVDSSLPVEMYAREPRTCDACKNDGDLFYSLWVQTEEEREAGDWSGIPFADRFKCPTCHLELSVSDLMLLHPNWDDTTYPSVPGPSLFDS